MNKWYKLSRTDEYCESYFNFKKLRVRILRDGGEIVKDIKIKDGKILLKMGDGTWALDDDQRAYKVYEEYLVDQAIEELLSE